MSFVTFLLGKWRIIAVGLLLAALAGMFTYIEILKLQKSELVTENKSLNFQLQSSQANLKSLAGKIDIQNEAIDNLKTAADKRLADNAELLRKAKAETVIFKKKADDYMARKPPEGLPLCSAANDLFNEAITKNGQ